jgi:hypothetical protein
MPQQRIANAYNMEEIVKRALKILNRELGDFLKEGRLTGDKKGERDLLVYLLWKKGRFTNKEIGRYFGISYSAVSHIVRLTESGMGIKSVNQDMEKEINSLFKM